MKRALLALALVASVALSACAGPLHTPAATYKPYGIANADVVKQPNVKYELSAGSVIVAIIFSETIIVPVYVVGWDLYAPVAAS